MDEVDEEYAPDTADVREAAALDGWHMRIPPAAFDRWLAEHDRGVAALTRTQIEWGVTLPADPTSVFPVNSEERARRLASTSPAGVRVHQRSVTEWRPL